MCLKDLQKYLEAEIDGASVPVNLIKIAMETVGSAPFHPGANALMPQNELNILVDGESCLDRLYGGFYSDWVCGGQWHRVVRFLCSLVPTMRNNKISMACYFDGTDGASRFEEWKDLQLKRRENVNLILRHIIAKGTPPPKIWWVPPTALRTCLSLALRHVTVPVLYSIEDHHQEVIGFCRERHFDALLADSADFAVFDPPRYLSASNLKLTNRGAIQTKELLLDVVARKLNLNPNRLVVFASLLGNHILPVSDLKDFHKRLVPEAKDESPTMKQLIPAVANFVRDLASIDSLTLVGASVFGSSADPRVAKFQKCVYYYMNGTSDSFRKFQNAVSIGAVGDSRPKAPGQEKVADKARATSPKTDVSSLPPVSKEVIRMASSRHARGLMSPYVYHLLTRGEICLPTLLEDEASRELPNIHKFYRPLRQNIYGILFNLYHHTFLANQDKEKKGELFIAKNSISSCPKSKDSDEAHQIPDIAIKEWVWCKGNEFKEPDHVRATSIGWAVPTVNTLWFGTGEDDIKRRMRAYLSCMRSDVQIMLNPAFVPQKLVILVSVLRYIMTEPHMQVLRPYELDAFLLSSFLPEIKDTEFTEDLTISPVTKRGVQLATLFMEGVEMAILANDVAGSPIPWQMVCPWLYFDGKVFQATLAKAFTSTSYQDLCDYRNDLILKLERLRKAVLDGLSNDVFAAPMLPSPRRPMYPHQEPSFPSNGRGARRGQSVSRGGPGGQLAVGGVVVGSWGPNPVARGRGRTRGPVSFPTRGRGQSRSVSTRKKAPGTNPKKQQNGEGGSTSEEQENEIKTKRASGSVKKVSSSLDDQFGDAESTSAAVIKTVLDSEN
ncbi:constitutive coactivator of PPAR-gamma-like protein 1 isoform X2 [Artemia franciscana]|uniref:constitutive coactivator of PPAR-gamma-like protein 1 isoform X2 n=1 Tax=Artemia franciscana TaxID=6661 RepID=UPI0032DB6FBC